MKFSSLSLNTILQINLKQLHYCDATPIQQQAIPLIRSGHDLLASAQTGTGKTAAFTLPILDLLAKNKSEKVANNTTIKALILTPTRELGQQVAKQLFKFTKYNSRNNILKSVNTTYTKVRILSYS